MKTPLLLACGSALMCLPAVANAQESDASMLHAEPRKDSGSKVEFVKTSSDTTVYKILEKDRPKNANDIPMPHFAIHTRDNKFVMTVGAQINAIVGADMGNNLYKIGVGGINFVPAAIAVPSTSGNRSDFYINPYTSDIDLQIVGFGGTKDQVTGYVKLGTNGNNANITLKKAYVTWRGLLAGYCNTIFEDELACPPTIDPQGPNGYVSTTVAQIAYNAPACCGFSWGAGISMPTYYTSNGVYLGRDYQGYGMERLRGAQVADPDYYSMEIPDVPMYVQYTGKGMNRVRLGAIVRPMLYRDLIKDSRRCTVGWGLSLSGNIQPVEPLVFYLQATYGKGIGAYIQDLAGMPLSFIPKENRPGEMTPTPMMGWLAGVTYNINPKWQVNAMASQARIWKAGAYSENQAEAGNLNNYKYGTYVAANVFYNVSSWFNVGVEYLYGRHQTWSHVGAGDNRLQCQLQFTL